MPRSTQRALVKECLLRNGGNVKRTVRETGIPESTVRRWKAESWPAPIGLEAFLARTHRDEETGCLIWDGRRSPDGYGLVDFGGRTRSSHRVSYELAHGTTLQPSEQLHHICRNRACVEASHLLPVEPGGPQGHAALHRLEGDFADALDDDNLEQALASLGRSAPWPAWMDATARVGSAAPEANARAR
jgi:hypothetical protein